MTQKMNNKRCIISIVMFLAVFGILLALATVFDLQVSKILVDLKPGAYFTKNVFGMAMETFGMTPGYIFIAFAFAIIYSNARKCEIKWVNIAVSAVSNIAAVVTMYIYADDTLGYIKRHTEVDSFVNSPLSLITCVWFALLTGELICSLMNKLDKETAKSLLKFSFIVICTFAMSNLVINAVKNVMYRPRYRTMWFLGDTEFTNFHRWYQRSEKPIIPEILAQVNGHKVGMDAYRSFPSGHTSSAGTIYALIALPKLLKKYNSTKWKVLFLTVSVCYTGIVAVSRIVCGAHFFSDVLIGGTVAFLCAVVFTNLFTRERKKA